MEAEDSAILRYAVKKLNDEIRKGAVNSQDAEEVDRTLFAALDEAVDISDELAPDDHEWFRQEVEKRRRVRRKMMVKIRRTHLRRWGRGFQLLDELLTHSEVLHAATEDCIGAWMLEDKSRYEDLLGIQGTLGGRALKCLLLLSLHSRACSISSEIRLLAEHGFPEAVKARTRSLHEIAVIALALSALGRVDTTVSDRYGAWAVAEARKESRAAVEQGGEPEPLTGDDAELERRAEAAWGSDFFRQNAWASPLFPGRRPPIPFSDIEKLVGMTHMRGYYMAGNDAIHAGPKALTNRVRFRNKSIFPTVSEVQHETVRHFLAVTAITLSDVCVTVCDVVASITHDYDLLAGVKIIRDVTGRVVDEFKRDGMRA
ncbi:DUF5677 domain-containing protein [Streptomyces griseoluteus]|uniref:DUF5677 domain-containing protein n=1 Tax=Streptomyces griseoluteus TaxID=29306 RepID=UPI00342AB79E